VKNRILALLAGAALLACSAAGGLSGGLAWAGPARAAARGHHPRESAVRAVSVRGAGLRVSVPRDWQGYQITSQTISQIRSKLQGDPSANQVVAALNGSLSHYIKFFALDQASHEDLLVMAIPVPQGATLQELQSALVPQLDALAKSPRVSRTTMGGKQAIRIDVATYKVTVQGKKIPSQSQFYALEGSDAIALDITGANSVTIKQIVGSVHFSR
jgi:hypothetical protein